MPSAEFAAALGRRAAILSRIAPSLRQSLGNLPEPVALDKDEERVRLYDAVAQFFIAVSQKTPLVLVLEACIGPNAEPRRC
jgi:hypothetical protein